jgi:hypothetical protein
MLIINHHSVNMTLPPTQDMTPVPWLTWTASGSNSEEMRIVKMMEWDDGDDDVVSEDDEDEEDGEEEVLIPFSFSVIYSTDHHLSF